MPSISHPARLLVLLLCAVVPACRPLDKGDPVRGEVTVAATRDDQPDNTVIGSENLWTQRPLAKDEMASAGIYVLVDHGNGELSPAQHLRARSVRVKVGDSVRAGEVVADVRNSGASLGPHLHYELRSGRGIRGVHGLPACFYDLTVVGTGEGTRGRPVLVSQRVGSTLLTQALEDTGVAGRPREWLNTGSTEQLLASYGVASARVRRSPTWQGNTITTRSRIC
jgi:hypothetical protein